VTDCTVVKCWALALAATLDNCRYVVGRMMARAKCVRYLVFTARRSYARAVLGVVILSVCLSVTRVLCD